MLNWLFGKYRFPVRLPDVTRSFPTTAGMPYNSDAERRAAFDLLWREASGQALYDAIGRKDAAAMAEQFAWIDALTDDRQGQSSTFCFDVLVLAKTLMDHAIQHRSRLLLNKARLYMFRSDDLGPGDLSHSVLNRDMKALLKDLEALKTRGWR